MRVNDDHTVTVTIMKDDETRDVVLRQPNMVELADLREMAWDADDSLPPIPVADDPPTQENVLALTKAINQRDRLIFSHDAPYGKVMVEAINRLSPETVDLANLPSDYLSPIVLKQMLDFYKNPLPGGASVTATMNANSAASSE